MLLCFALCAEVSRALNPHICCGRCENLCLCNMERTCNPQRGISCLALEDVVPTKKQISRSFGAMVLTQAKLREAVPHLHVQISCFSCCGALAEG